MLRVLPGVAGGSGPARRREPRHAGFRDLLLGLLEPTRGHASVLGFDTRTRAVDIRARTGALLEFAGLYERMSAQDNLDLYGRIYRMPRSDRRARIKELLTNLDRWDRRAEPVGNWSRGMKQKLAVARALIHRPPLVCPRPGSIRWQPPHYATIWPAWSPGKA
jgi:ABC-type Na+ transport system ATPase subunit NatA